MGSIVILDQNMINMIAAGEVIERPASVVKELIENSIDAGAAKINVSVEDGGRKLICVTDNGCGMDGTDLEMAFAPHATSKIKTAADLHNISTLGFRGEALASIASVAHLQALSKTAGQDAANCIEIDCGSKGVITPCSSDTGTIIRVRDLFYKLPARQKFLKTANTELGHIIEQFIRIALANCDIDMTLIHNGKELYRLTSGQQLRQRIAGMFSAEISDGLIDAESDEKSVHISALFGKPAISRLDSKYQYIFVNDRFIRDKTVSHAIREAYRGSIEPNRFPVVFLFIRMPHEDYDVNVHPTKTEVRFYNSNLLHSQVIGCLREKLLAADIHPEASLAQAGHKQKISDAISDFMEKYKAGQPRQQSEFYHTAGPGKADGHEPYSVRDGYTSGAASLPAQKKFLQIHDSFIVTQTNEGFIIVDQHAMHERIMYENLLARVSAGRLEAQRLLIPESFEITDADAGTIGANTAIFEKLGIELAPFGPRKMAIQAFPTMLGKAPPVELVRDLIDLLDRSSANTDAERLLDDVLHMAACKAAIKAGQRLSDGEIEHLLADRERVEYSSRCPHGRPTAIKFSITELEKQFGRT